MFGWELPPENSGGLGVACDGLARALAQKNTEIIFVLPRPSNVASNMFRVLSVDGPNIRAKIIDSPLSPYMTSREYQLLGITGALAQYGHNLLAEVRRYAERARRIASSEQFDIIHAHDWLSFLAGMAAKQVSGKPLVVHVHATEFDRTGGLSVNQAVYEIERAGMIAADQVIAVSQYTKELITEKYGINQDKIAVVHNGIDLQYGADPEPADILKLKTAGNQIVLFVGRITLQKGVDYLLAAAPIVLKYNPRVFFVIAGAGDMERQIISEAAERGVADHVIFTGFVRDQELKSLYRAADLFVMPSVSEPFGITTLESLALGTPVLISKQSGVAEVLSHCLKVDFWDTEEMAHKILAVLAHPALQECLAQNGSQEVQKCTWSRAADKCLEIYQKVLQNFQFPNGLKIEN